MHLSWFSFLFPKLEIIHLAQRVKRGVQGIRESQGTCEKKALSKHKQLHWSEDVCVASSAQWKVQLEPGGGLHVHGLHAPVGFTHTLPSLNQSRHCRSAARTPRLIF